MLKSPFHCFWSACLIECGVWDCVVDILFAMTRAGRPWVYVNEEDNSNDLFETAKTQYGRNNSIFKLETSLNLLASLAFYCTAFMSQRVIRPHEVKLFCLLFSDQVSVYHVFAMHSESDLHLTAHCRCSRRRIMSAMVNTYKTILRA